ncbi:unnamed protein product, partial [Nesidiocoris tenuis]
MNFKHGLLVKGLLMGTAEKVQEEEATAVRKRPMNLNGRRLPRTAQDRTCPRWRDFLDRSPGQSLIALMTPFVFFHRLLRHSFYQKRIRDNTCQLGISTRFATLKLQTMIITKFFENKQQQLWPAITLELILGLRRVVN